MLTSFVVNCSSQDKLASKYHPMSMDHFEGPLLINNREKKYYIGNGAAINYRGCIMDSAEVLINKTSDSDLANYNQLQIKYFEVHLKECKSI